MLIKDLEKNEVVNTLVNNIISDKTFKEKCEVNFKKIFDDGKIDNDDIPIIINLVLTIYNNHNKIKVSKENMKPVFMLLISKLLNEFKGDIPIDESVVLLMLEPQIDLLLMSVASLGKIKLPCCGSKPQKDDEDNVVNKIKINRIDKDKTKKIVVKEEQVIKVEEIKQEDILPEIIVEEQDKEVSDKEEEPK
tara:strand:- start:676 stop:1251 length:576 start_codon:yes stop_codon:yes gene_type:complete